MTAQIVSKDSVNFRSARESDLDSIVELIKFENWFILTRSKMEIIYNENVAKFYVITERNNDNKVLGAANMTKTKENEAILGILIIRKGFRGNGLGTYLLDKVISLQGDVIVNWVSAADSFYTKLGYHKCEQSFCLVNLDMHREKLDKYCNENPMPDGVQIVFLSEDQVEDLVQYDTGARGYEARKFLSMVIRTSDNVAMAFKGSDKRILGYTALNKEEAGTLLFNGFYADADTIAAALLKKALDTFPYIATTRFYTMFKRQFLVQFGEPIIALEHGRFSSGRWPALIPEEKVYCISESDVTF